MSQSEMHCTDVTFYVRQTGSLRARYQEVGKQTDTDIALPSDAGLLYLVLKRLLRSVCVLCYLFDDASLIRYATREQRRKLHRVLTKLLYSCEVCGEPTKIYYTDEDKWVHRYCMPCYREVVMKEVELNPAREHPGYNVGNEQVLRSDLTYHGHGVLEDFF